VNRRQSVDVRYAIHTADADASHLSSWVASAVCTQCATSWRQSRRVRTNLPTAKSSCVVSTVWSCERPRIGSRDSWVALRWWHSDDRHRPLMTSLTRCWKKLSISINIRVMVKPLCSVSKLSTESVGSRRELIANCVHTADADATQLDIQLLYPS